MSSMPTLCPSFTRCSSPSCPTGLLTPSPSILRSGTVISLQGRLLSNRFYRRKRFCIHSPEFSLWLCGHAAPVNNFETGGMCKSYCYIICCCTYQQILQKEKVLHPFPIICCCKYILYTLHGSQNSEHGLCLTLWWALHYHWSPFGNPPKLSHQPKDRGARSSAQHQVPSKVVCH